MSLSMTALYRQLGEIVNDTPPADWFRQGRDDPLTEPVEGLCRPVNTTLWDRPSSEAMADWQATEDAYGAAWDAYQKHRNVRRYRADIARLRAEMED